MNFPWQSYYHSMFPQLAETEMAKWADQLQDDLQLFFDRCNHGDLPEWQEILNQLPKIPPVEVLINQDTIQVNSADPNLFEQQKIEHLFRQLIPWRKGPYRIHDVFIDTEWRSDWKWQRLENHIQPLKDKTVLDVGCGSGYHCWRMAGAGARLVIGVDPYLLFLIQFFAIRHYLEKDNVHLLPFPLEALPHQLLSFDTIFSMGVLYHRRSPMDHLRELYSSLRPGGELVLETLVVDGDKNTVLVPEDRYAGMRNVWFLPSPDALAGWIKRCGFSNVRLLDCNETSIEEQRSTSWMPHHSLTDQLDPADKRRTKEGLPRPLRAIFLASRP